MSPTPDETLQRAGAGLERAFRPDAARGVDTVIQYALTGEGGLEFYATIHRQTLRLDPGRAPKAKVSMTMAADEFFDMLEGRLSSTEAFMSGKLKLGGSFMFATKLARLFRFVAP